MKFVFIVIVLSAFIALSSCYVNPNYATPDPEIVKDLRFTVINDTFYSANTFDKLLDWTFRDTQHRIWLEWVKCNQTFPVAHDEARGLFDFDVWADKKSTDIKEQLAQLVDCTLRATGVITDAGLDEEKYMLQIRKLRFNHTGFDIKKESMENKRQIWDTVYNKVKDYPVLCYGQGPDPSQWGTQSLFGSFGGTPSNWPANCYNLILSYARAAKACKDLKDPDGIEPKTTWLIMQCVMTVNRNNNSRAPFYLFFLRDNSEEDANLVGKLVYT